jgi:small subunit ribosomal protein S6
MRHYETTYVLRPNLGEDLFTEIIERTNAIVTDHGGSVINIDRWGIKRLAYEVKKETQGCYIYMNYAAPGNTIKELERIFRIDDQVLRYLTVKLADEIDEAGVDREKEIIAAKAAAKVAEAEELARQAEEGDSASDDEKVGAEQKQSAPDEKEKEQVADSAE